MNSLKRIISTNKRFAKHPLASQNIQHSLIIIKVDEWLELNPCLRNCIVHSNSNINNGKTRPKKRKMLIQDTKTRTKLLKKVHSWTAKEIGILPCDWWFNILLLWAWLLFLVHTEYPHSRLARAGADTKKWNYLVKLFLLHLTNYIFIPFTWRRKKKETRQVSWTVQDMLVW